MEGVLTNMRRLLVVALSANTCCGQLAPEMCPYGTELKAGSFLETRPWSFLRSIDINVKHQHGGGPTDAPYDPVSQPSSVNAVSNPSFYKQGTVRAVIFALTNTYELEDPDGNVVAKLSNSWAPWDPKQTIYNCKDVEVGSLEAKYNAWDAFWNRYTPHEVHDAMGRHVANLEIDEDGGSFFGSPQHMLILKSVNGDPLVAMTNGRKGWKFGPFGEHWEAQIEFFQESLDLPMPASAPEFLSLVFANMLASNNFFGPIWAIIMGVIFLVLFCCCCACCCTNPKAKENKVAEKDGEEESLIDEGKSLQEPAATKGGVFACCSRRQVVDPQKSMRDHMGAMGSSMNASMTQMSASMKESTSKGWQSTNDRASQGWATFKTNVGARSP